MKQPDKLAFPPNYKIISTLDEVPEPLFIRGQGLQQLPQPCLSPRGRNSLCLIIMQATDWAMSGRDTVNALDFTPEEGRVSGWLLEVSSNTIYLLTKYYQDHQGNKTNFSLQDYPPCSPRYSWTLPEFLLLHKLPIKCSLVQIPALIFSGLPSTLSSYHQHHFSVKSYQGHLSSLGRNQVEYIKVDSRTGLETCSNIWSSQARETKKEKQQKRSDNRTSHLLN